MNFEQIARTVAPTIATGLLGPLGGVVANIAAGFLFPDAADKTKVTTQDVINKITSIADPADFAKLRDAEAAVRKFEADNGFRFAQLDAESQQDARVMRTTALASGNHTADQLAWLTVGSFLFVAASVLLLIGLVLGNTISITSNPSAWAAVSGLIGSVLGYFSANAQQVIGFYFGSSAGSAAKSDQLSQHTSEVITQLGRASQSQQPPAPPPPLPPGLPPAPPPQAGLPVVKVEQTAEGATTMTVAAGEPESGQLVRDAKTTGAPPHPAALLMPSDDDAARFAACMAFVFAQEGGFVDDPVDAGGATNMGITLRTLAHFRHATVSVDDVRNLTRAEAEEIYRDDYWAVGHAEVLPAGVDLCVFDSCVLFGPRTAGLFLQTALGFTGADLDGLIGKNTLAAANKAPPRQLIEGIAASRVAHHRAVVQAKPSQERFLNGWLNRTQKLQAAALAMVKA